MSPEITQPVFLDPYGRRARGWRRFWLVVGAVATLLGLMLIIGVLSPPLAPQLNVRHTSVFAATRDQRERNAFRRRATQVFRKAPPARRGELIPPGGGRLDARPKKPTDLIVAGFYVNWQDNSRASLNKHINDLDWVIGEWSFLAPGGDSVKLRVDRQVFDVARRGSDTTHPAFFIQLSNYDTATADFSVPALRHLLTRPAAQAKVIQQITNVILTDSLAGVTIDLEDVPDNLEDQLVAFTAKMRASLAPHHRLVTQAVHAETAPWLLRRLAAVNDYLFAMLFDEHYRTGTPGPIASQQFYEQHARAITSVVNPSKVILMIGQYGYDWNDKTGKLRADETTFQSTMRAARENDAATHFDPVSLNPYIQWTEDDSTDHYLWYLDGATAYNELRVGQALGVAGAAIWRLGADDPSLWQVLDRRGLISVPDSLRTIPPGYDVEFIEDEFREPSGTVDSGGEILHIRERPTSGERSVRVDPGTRLIVGDSITNYPSPYVVDRYGYREHRVALTFDDGPDGTWTPLILDTLRAKHAPATFFVIGDNVTDHIPLLQREYNEGHEIGNHTFTHPNLALVGEKRTAFEIDAGERVIQSALDHRTAFFRPPYFGDATPTTPDELDAVEVATRKGYLTIGLRDDAEDWTPISIQQIIHNVIAGRDSGNIVLLHDGGGDRSRTVAALGPIIDSLRANGDTLVLVSELVGIPRDQAMPPLPPASEAARVLDLAGFAVWGVIEVILFWVFSIAVVLGIGRLLIIASLAVIQRLFRHQRRGAPTPYAPPVSIIVPAYNESKVIVATITSLREQQYAGPIEIIVVDDGSPDTTYQVACQHFGGTPGVQVYRKENGGKASALNFGLTRASHEIVIGLDADTLFASDTVAELVQPLANPRVGAVAGNAKVGNRVNLVTRWQALEYVTSQNLDRRAFSLLDGITVVPGAVGAWRKSLVREVGGFRNDTLAEDQDLTLNIRRRGYSIAYADGAIGYTEAPDTLKALAKQRFRWSFGTLQCAWKHRDTLFRNKYGSLGWAALPNVWLFQLLLPALSPIADLMFVFSLLSIVLTRYSHGATYALTSLEKVLTYYAIFLLVDWLAAAIAFIMEPGEDKSLTWLIFLQRFVYRQLMYWVVVRSFKAAVQGRVVGWGKLERKATVQLPLRAE
jgi:cellulose synthase/poly-beta-1,6-N-acetylglucosamine synthase-like glycosyltransferase/peptidoglycan/xylan/chitin deacetylase (PgdA/CDA1 family)/spore germination protein YaaH